MRKPLTIAVDFDGTIVEHKFPAIGNELPFATHTLKTLQEKGHRLILWTYRSGQQLDEAVDFCKERGLTFYAVNKNYPEEKMSDNISRKILADVYIDDRNIGGMPSWTEIYHLIHPEEAPKKEKQKSKSWWW
ncbi:BT0820 family HAD-type phosphatase [uncultured Sunxiuqinia sp.]|uniref:BT0820 family HAD-type phosphatase n=1 Tax=uncultured Sunxiuqinia sp. TaxID=1573825 RepID=UPI00260B3BA5|nr:hydrolase [uncultured Sunxiuqinia sp.]